MFPFFTRKQLYRKYCFYQNDIYIKIENENIPIINKKKVRFKNQVYLTLIPTRQELDDIKHNTIIYLKK